MSALLLVALLAPGCPTSGVDGAKMYAAGNAARAAGTHGEHLTTQGFEVAVRAYRAAAEAGQIDAQYTLAWLIISTRYQASGISAKQKAEYVEALTWLAVAAKRGHARARTFLPPGVMGKLLKEPMKATKDDAFSDLPAAWLEEAHAKAVPLARCWPAVKPNR